MSKPSAPVSSSELHPLLLRQMRQSGFNPDICPEASDFLSRINAAYGEFERERKLNLRASAMMAEELQENVRSLQNILAGLNIAVDGIVLANSEDRIIYANHAFSEIFGLSDLPDPIGQHFDDLWKVYNVGIPPLQRKAILTELQREDIWKGETSLRSLHPPLIRQVLLHVRLLPDGGRVAVISDITQTRNRELEQRRLENQLEQARKLEALGKLAGGVVHDFNNLLGAILGFAQFILDDTEDDSPLHHYAFHITNAGQQAKLLIEQILAFSRHHDDASEMIDLGELINGILHILNAVIAPTAALIFVKPETSPVVFASRSPMAQVLTNLVINAGEALGSAPGSITISVGPMEPGIPEIQRVLYPDLTVPLQESNAWTDQDGRHHVATGILDPSIPYACLSVSDTGCGMTSEVSSKIFTPFFTTKRRSGGTGLGLAVVQSIILQERGCLIVSTKPGEGCLFRVFLPISSAEASAEAKPAEIAAISHQGTILLVEDNQHFSEMMSTGLERLGYQVCICTQATEALDVIDEDPQAWDMVITGQALSEMPGTELIAKIKTKHPNLPCLICTAYSSQLTEEAALQSGANGFMTKPINFGAFSILVKRLIEA